MNCEKCDRLNYIKPKSLPCPPVRVRKKPAPKNVIKIKFADNPKDIVVRFSDKETLLKTLREMLDV